MDLIQFPNLQFLIISFHWMRLELIGKPRTCATRDYVVVITFANLFKSLLWYLLCTYTGTSNILWVDSGWFHSTTYRSSSKSKFGNSLSLVSNNSLTDTLMLVKSSIQKLRLFLVLLAYKSKKWSKLWLRLSSSGVKTCRSCPVREVKSFSIFANARNKFWFLPFWTALNLPCRENIQSLKSYWNKHI